MIDVCGKFEDRLWGAGSEANDSSPWTSPSSADMTEMQGSRTLYGSKGRSSSHFWLIGKQGLCPMIAWPPCLDRAVLDFGAAGDQGLFGPRRFERRRIVPKKASGYSDSS